MNEVERAEDIGTDQGALVTRWLREIELADAHEKDWRQRSEKIIKRYRDDDRKDAEDTKSRFNILYANTEVLKGVMYQKTPVPDVRRRFLDKDPIGRQAAQIIQRALSYSIDSYDFDGLMKQSVEDVLLPGRAVARVKYVPTMKKVPVPQEDGTVKEEEQVVYHEVSCDYVEWKWFRCSPAASWKKVRWVAFGELMTRDELVSSFGEAGKACALDWKPEDEKYQNDDLFKRALVWAVWDKTSRNLIFVAKGYTSGPLQTVPDPLGLEGFFPCPKPVFSITTNGNMVPVPEFVQYQDQAIELDNITQRIDALVDALRRRGVYDKAYPEIERLAEAGDNDFIAVENFTNLAEKGGIAAALWESPIETIAKVLVGLYQQREQIKQVIYEVTGIADIVRGTTKSDETLGAQELKARYANVRVAPRQQAIQQFARDLMRMKAELIAEKFDATTLKLMTGENLWSIEGPDGQPRDITNEIMQLLKDERLRGFRIDIETDSTIQPDATNEQKNRVEFLTAVAGFITNIAPAVQSGAIPMETARELLSFGARAFKMSPQLEDALDKIGGQQSQQQKAEAEGMRKAGAEAELRERQAKAMKTEAEAKNIGAEAQMKEMTNMADKTTTDAMAGMAQMMQQQQQMMQSHMEMMGQMMQGFAQTQGAIAQALSALAGPKRTELVYDGQGKAVASISQPVAVQ